jgi:hypothetical protein
VLRDTVSLLGNRPDTFPAAVILWIVAFGGS